VPDILQLQREKTVKLEEMRSILTKSQEEKRNLTDDEITKFNTIESETKDITASIKREETLAALEKENELRNQSTKIPADDSNNTNSPPENRFENIGEFFATVATNRNDERLLPFKENRTAQQMGTGSLGGFAIPEQFLNEIKSVTPQGSIIRPRATVIKAGSPPDAKINIPALDQGASKNMYGGIEVIHGGETFSITETNAALRQVTLEPKSLKGFIPVSNELINNWSAATSFLQAQMRLAINGAEDYDFYRGTGVNSATGILNSACRVNYTRATANTIVYNDIVGMLARAKMGGVLAWIASQTTIPQLATMADAGSNNIWIQSSVAGIPTNILGFPVIFSDRAPALGTAGDLALVDASYYLIKDGSGPRVDISKDFLFQNDETAFRIVWMVDGQSWLKAPIPLEGSTGNTISPFVVLN